MTIPKHDDIRIYALRYLSDNGDVKLKEFEQPLAQQFNLTDKETSQMYDSGKGPVFYDRVAWALSYLSMANLVDKPKRGVYRINKLGLEMLSKPDTLESYIQEKVRQRTTNKRKEDDTIEHIVIESEMTPQEHLYQSYSNIRSKVYDEILDTIISKSPYEFEHLVVKLLEKMGYGGQVKDAGLVTQASNDGGIDGIIKEDVLGLGRIHIQAKRYSKHNTIGREEIQKFVGALAGAQSSKGIFITTSSYKPTASNYANSLNGSSVTLVLIDGIELAKYIYDYNLGMQLEQVIEIKKLDSDYWDSLKDDPS